MPVSITAQDSNSTDQTLYVIREVKPGEGAEDPWFIFRKPVVDHPGICKECGYDVCLRKQIPEGEVGWKEDTELHDNIVGLPPDETSPWEQVADYRKPQLEAALKAHMAEAHSRFSRRTMTLDEISVGQHKFASGKDISVAEKRALDAKAKRSKKQSNNTNEGE